MVAKFANVYTFRNTKTGESMDARWDIYDGGQTNYTGPGSDWEFVSAELNVPDGLRSDEQALEMDMSQPAGLPPYVQGAHVRVTPV